MIKKGDTVVIISGREKGKTGKVLEILSERGRATVEKLNMVKRHQKPTQKMRQGGIVEKEASVHLSNLMLYCQKCTKPRKMKWHDLKEGKRVRVCKKCGEQIDAI